MAHKDGKLAVGDRVVSINGVDLAGATHDQAVAMLTGLERFVRLVVEREVPSVRDGAAPSPGPQQSPRLFGLPKPYTGLYSANSYMANRPGLASYRRSLEVDKKVRGCGGIGWKWVGRKHYRTLYGCLHLKLKARYPFICINK